MHLAETPTMFHLDGVNKKYIMQPNMDVLYKKWKIRNKDKEEEIKALFVVVSFVKTDFPKK